MTETRIPIERVNTQSGEVTGTGTARMRGATIDDYETHGGAELKLRPGEAFVVAIAVVTLTDEDSS